MLRAEENEILTRVGPGTLMGELLRRYWTPACLTAEIPEPGSPPAGSACSASTWSPSATPPGRSGWCRRTARTAAQSLYSGRNEDAVAPLRLKLPDLIAARSASERDVRAFAQAIMTTDTRPKLASARFRASSTEGSKEVTVLGIAKGSGMIHPQLATLLVYLFTDVGASARELQPLLREACDDSLSCMSIDGDTSTNDTVLLLASGASGARVRDVRTRRKLSAALAAVCQSLAEQIVSDGEGVQHVIRLFVEQARNREEALLVARTIAHSMLVKTAWAGADPNWGRILAAVGRCGLPIDPSRVQIFIGSQKVCRNGIACAFNERQAHRNLAQPVCDIRVQLGRGRQSVRFLTTDLTAEYVRINADYST